MNTNATEHNKDTMINDLLKDLKLVKNDLTKQSEERIELYEQVAEKDRTIEELKQQKIYITMQIEQIKIKSHPDIQEIKNLFNEKEVNVIINGMDKTDYNEECGRKQDETNKYPRFLDLEKITCKVKGFKKTYPKWFLIEVKRGLTVDCLPPRTSYSYKFKDSSGTVFNVG